MRSMDRLIHLFFDMACRYILELVDSFPAGSVDDNLVPSTNIHFSLKFEMMYQLTGEGTVLVSRCLQSSATLCLWCCISCSLWLLYTGN